MLLLLLLINKIDSSVSEKKLKGLAQVPDVVLHLEPHQLPVLTYAHQRTLTRVVEPEYPLAVLLLLQQVREVDAALLYLPYHHFVNGTLSSYSLLQRIAMVLYLMVVLFGSDRNEFSHLKA